MNINEVNRKAGQDEPTNLWILPVRIMAVVIVALVAGLMLK